MTFDTLWGIWPRNDKGQKPNKGGALKAWEKKTKVQKIVPEVIIEAAKKVADWYDRHPNDSRYVKHLQTWLNADGWIGVDEEFPGEVRPSLRQQLNEASDGENEYRQISRESNERAEAANQWWKDNGHAPELYREYEHRRKHGVPTEEDNKLIGMRVAADKLDAGWQDRADVKPKTTFVPMKRDVVQPDKEVMLHDEPDGLGLPAPDKTDPQQVAGGEPPEPPPVQSLEEYGDIR